MAFRASNIVPSKGYNEAKEKAWSARLLAQDYLGRIAAGTNADQLFNVVRRLDALASELNSYRTISGIAAYAQDQENDPAYDAAAEFTAVINAVEAARDEIISTFPTSGGYLLSHSFNGATREPRQFQSASLTVLATRLQAIVDAVE